MDGNIENIFFYVILIISLSILVIYCFFILIYSVGIKDAVLSTNSAEASYYIETIKYYTLILLILDVLFIIFSFVFIYGKEVFNFFRR